jgi:DedD protein
MALPPPPKRSTEAGTDVSDAVAQARTKARRRLVGALVLLGIGIVAFPLVFESQPRPVAVDIPIEIPRKDGAPPLAVPAPRPIAPAASVAAPVDAAPAPVEKAEVVEKPAERTVEKPAEKPTERPVEKPAPAEKPARPVAASAPPARTDGARAQALLEGAAASKPAATGRFVVQVGAFTDAAAVREARARVEKLGLKTYTQAVETSTGTRTRVRMGPFDSREDAERALARAKAAGLDGVLLTL